MAGVTTLTLTDSGEGFTFPPYVKFSEPDEDSAVAGVVLTMTDSGSIANPNSITLTETGNFYTDSPDISVSANQKIPIHFVRDGRFGNFAYGNGLTLIDSNFTTGWDYDFGNPGTVSTTAVSFSFFVKVPSRFQNPSNSLNNQTFNIVEFRRDIEGTPPLDSSLYGSISLTVSQTANTKLTYKKSSNSINDAYGVHRAFDFGLFADSNGSGGDIADSQWHYVQIIRAYSAPSNQHSLYVNRKKMQGPIASSQSDDGIFLRNSITMRNRRPGLTEDANLGGRYTDGWNHGILLDEIRFRNNTVIRDIPDSSDSAVINFENFEIDSAVLTATLSNGTVTAIQNTNPRTARFMDSATLVVGGPTGTPGDFVAQARTLIDSSAGKVSQLILVDSGNFYLNPPTMTILGGSNRESSYERGDAIEQTLSTGVKIRGEVLGYLLDSDGDSARVLSVGHVGADDGKFREFVVNRDIINTSQAFTTGLEVVGVDEENNMSENEQNEFFTTSDIDDFLNFSEDNPFGDPENQ